MSKKYIFAGDKGGVPGLPAVLTTAEAKELGVEDLLNECIDAGLYKEEKPAKKPKERADNE